MSKTQKIWLGICIAMFIVPEILWGPVLSVLNLINIQVPVIFQSSETLQNNFSLIILILLCQFIGLVGFFILIKRHPGISRLKKSFALSVTIILLICLVIVTYLSYALDQTFR